MSENEKKPRGFAAMTEERRKEIASAGGKAAHQRGAAHRWTENTAREAGRKGGRSAAERRASLADEQKRSSEPNK